MRCVDFTEVDLELSVHPGSLGSGFTHFTQRREDTCNTQIPVVNGRSRLTNTVADPETRARRGARNMNSIGHRGRPSFP